MRGSSTRCSPAGRCGATREPGGAPLSRTSPEPTPNDSRSHPTRRETMAAHAPETSAEAGGRWLDPFLSDWKTGTGGRHAVREPATGRDLLTVDLSTPDDVRRAAQ